MLMVSATMLECRISKMKKLVKYQNFIKTLKIYQKLLFSSVKTTISFHLAVDDFHNKKIAKW